MKGITPSNTLAGLIRGLEYVRARPHMYIGGPCVDAAITYLNGYTMAAISALGIERYGARHHEVTDHVLATRGLRQGSAHWSRELAARGMSPDQIIDEMLCVEIEVFRRLTAASESGCGTS